jgi:hypothetical protein
MKKELIAVFCVVTIFASTAPIFAADTTTTTNKVGLTPNQITKLDNTQTQLTKLVAKIEALKKKYPNTKKNKGLLKALNQYEKQANKLNTAITNYRTNPTKPTNIKIKNFQIKTKQLQFKVLIKANILKKINKPKHSVIPCIKTTTVTT